MIIEEIIKYNEQFVANKGYEKYLTSKYPDKKIANDNMIAYIVSSWMMEKNTDSINLDKFYQTFPFFKNKLGVDSIFIKQRKNY